MPAPIQPWLPAIFMIVAIWIGLIYNNKRLDDFTKRIDDLKDLVRSEVGGSEANVRKEMIEMRSDLKAEIADLRVDLKHDIAGLDRRLERLETPHLSR